MLKYTRFASKVFKQFRVQFSIVLIFVYDNASMKKPYIIKKINLQSNNLGSDLKVDLDGSPCWTRTNDPAVNSRMLYRLS